MTAVIARICRGGGGEQRPLAVRMTMGSVHRHGSRGGAAEPCGGAPRRFQAFLRGQQRRGEGRRSGDLPRRHAARVATWTRPLRWRRVDPSARVRRCRKLAQAKAATGGRRAVGRRREVARRWKRLRLRLRLPLRLRQWRCRWSRVQGVVAVAPSPTISSPRRWTGRRFRSGADAARRRDRGGSDSHTRPTAAAAAAATAAGRGRRSGEVQHAASQQGEPSGGGGGGGGSDQRDRAAAARTLELEGAACGPLARHRRLELLGLQDDLAHRQRRRWRRWRRRPPPRRRLLPCFCGAMR